MALSEKDSFETWLKLNRISLRILSGGLGNSMLIGHQVGKLNGAAQSMPLNRPNLQLEIKNLTVWMGDFKPTVVLYNYGANDASAGVKGIPQFKVPR